MVYRTERMYLFRKKDCKSLWRFLFYIGVKKNSYAGRVAKRVYDEFFGDSFNLKKHYKKYYKKEFNSYQDFLINKCNLSESFAYKISKGKYYCTLRKYKKDNPSYYLDMVDAVRDLFVQFTGGVIDEN